MQVKLQPTPEQSEALARTLEMANRAANRLSQWAWESQEFRQFPLHKRFYRPLREEFALSAQIVVRLIAKVADGYKLDQKVQRTFRLHGAISYDLRVLSWNLASESVSIWSLEGRLAIPFVCGQRQRELLAFPRGETDLVYRDRQWYLFTVVEIPDVNEQEALGWLGVDLGVVAIAQTSEGQRFAGGQLNGLRARYRRLRCKLQSKGSRAAKRLLRRRKAKEQRFATWLNHNISKKIVTVAKRTGRGIALESLKGLRGRVRAQKPQRSRLHSWAFGQLQAFMCYKARAAGVAVRFVDARNTSRTCARCGSVNAASRKTQSRFVCVPCGHRANADANAAIVIGRRAAVNWPDCSGLFEIGAHRSV